MDADLTKTERFRHSATNRKADPARCTLAAQPEADPVSFPQFLTQVLAEEGTLELTPFASAPGHSAPCSTRPSPRSPNEERKCRT